jgi:hypothetical protein
VQRQVVLAIDPAWDCKLEISKKAER